VSWSVGAPRERGAAQAAAASCMRPNPHGACWAAAAACGASQPVSVCRAEMPPTVGWGPAPGVGTKTGAHRAAAATVASGISPMSWERPSCRTAAAHVTAAAAAAAAALLQKGSAS
jgi:hypothetical protein